MLKVLNVGTLLSFSQTHSLSPEAPGIIINSNFFFFPPKSTPGRCPATLEERNGNNLGLRGEGGGTPEWNISTHQLLPQRLLASLDDRELPLGPLTGKLQKKSEVPRLGGKTRAELKQEKRDMREAESFTLPPDSPE